MNGVPVIRLLGALTTVLVVSAAQANLLINGGFEAGDFTGWTATNHGNIGCNTDWNVSDIGGDSATQCTGDGAWGFVAPDTPLEGSYAAYHSFDGEGPQVNRLTQDFIVPESNSLSLSWADTASWELSEFAGSLDRVFSVDLYDGDDLVANVFTLIFEFGTSDEYDWQERRFSISSGLAGRAGDTLTLAFSNKIPETYTGPAGFGLDFVELNAVPVPAALYLFGSALGLLGWLRANSA